MPKFPRKKLLTITAIALGIIFLGWITFLFLGYSFEFFLSQRLANAKTVWEENKPSSYQYTLRVNQYHVYHGAYQITVLDGLIVDIKAQRNPLNYASEFEPLEEVIRYNPDTMQILPTAILDYTIDNLFNIAETQLKTVPVVHITNCGDGEYHAEFDAQLGYIKSFAANKYLPAGFFCGTFHAMGESFRIENFEVLDL